MNPTQKSCLASCLFIPDIKNGKLYYESMHHWVSYRLIDAKEAAHNLRELVQRSILLQLQGFQGKYIQLPEETYAILHSLNTLNPVFLKLSGLPLSPKFLELKVLILQGNADLTRIPPMFFCQIPLLWILDLSYTSVRELPNSFFELEQLKELYLKGCKNFMKLPPEIGRVKKLEKLDLDGTEIIHMPEEVQDLTNLQSLTLCFFEYHGKKNKKYTCSTIIPSGVISKLKGLIHLSIDVNPDDERWHENVQAILPEILELEFLQSLCLYLPQPQLLKIMQARVFELDFRFVVGQHMQRLISGTPPRVEVKFKQSGYSLKYVKGKNVPNEIKRLLKHCKALFLDRHMTIKNLSKFSMMNLEQLQVCILAECKEMQTIADGRYSKSKDILPHLLFLSVSYMKNLRSIWEGAVHSCHSFGMLKSLELQHCPNLVTIFISDFVGNLSLLEELMVKDCPKVTTLISHESSSISFLANIFLAKLKRETLLHLPELINISNGLPSDRA